MKRVIAIALSLFLAMYSLTDAQAATAVKLNSYIGMDTEPFTECIEVNGKAYQKVRFAKNSTTTITAMYNASDTDAEAVGYTVCINRYFKYFSKVSVSAKYSFNGGKTYTKAKVKCYKRKGSDVVDLQYTDYLQVDATLPEKVKMDTLAIVKFDIKNMKAKF